YRPTGVTSVNIADIAPPNIKDDDLDSLFGDDDEEEEEPPLKKLKGSPPTPEEPVNSTFEKDPNVFLCTGTNGIITILDHRQQTPCLRLNPPKSTAPFAMSSTWSTSGNSIFVGRRNAHVEELSLRMPFDSHTGDTLVQRNLKFPSVSGAVTTVKSMPNSQHVVCGSFDNIRIYDLNKYDTADSRTPFWIVPGHHGGVLSRIEFDPSWRYCVSASGGRGVVQGQSTEMAYWYSALSVWLIGSPISLDKLTHRLIMAPTKKAGVLGATGSVGQRFILLLNQHPDFELAVLGASGRSAGKRYEDAVTWKQTGLLPDSFKDIVVSECTVEAFKDCDVVFSGLDHDYAGPIELAFKEAGLAVVSNAKNYRREANVPLIVPTVNTDHLSIVEKRVHDAVAAGQEKPGFIVCISNCSTAGVVAPLKPLVDQFGPLDLVTATTLQAVSGAGFSPGVPSMDILDNIVPFIGGEEDKI
ncbi:hypothetical protein WICPIJ_001479, partial [Wickerhamomyces pijperi]